MDGVGTICFVETVDELATVLASRRRAFRVERVGWNDAGAWALERGALQHRSGGFFSVVGVVFDTDPAGETLSLFQPQAAVTGLLTTVRGGKRYFLLQARPEPGCLGGAQFGPTVQSTPANFMQLHGGATTPYIGWFVTQRPGARWCEDTTQSDLGRRYLMKSKRQIVVECPADVELQDGFVWASIDAIARGLARDAFFNIDLRSILSGTAWSSQADDPLAIVPADEASRRSLGSPLRTETLGALGARLAPRPSPARFTPIEALRNWQRTEWGLREIRELQGFAVEFYRVAAPGREVERWAQPLINSSGDGHVLLLCRESAAGLEVLVRAVAEPGLAAGVGLAPSFVRYPGERPPRDAPLEARYTTRLATLESDEGGRFFRDASRYELGWLDGPLSAAVHGAFWLRLSELKTLLCRSNVCTIQLRGVASLLAAIH